MREKEDDEVREETESGWSEGRKIGIGVRRTGDG